MTSLISANMAHNSEVGGSQKGGEDPMQASIEDALTKTFNSLFPTICEFVRTWMKGGQVGPPPMIGYGYGNSITNLTPIMQNHDTPEDAQVKKPKNGQKRSKKHDLDDSNSQPVQGTKSKTQQSPFVDRIPIND